MWYQYLCLYLSIYHIYIIQYYSAFKNERNIGICSNMDGPGDYHTKWSKSDWERQISYDITYMWNLTKKWYKWTFLQNRNRLTDIENKHDYQRGKCECVWGGGEDKLGV